MGIFSEILLFPITGPLEGVLWIADKMLERAEGEIYNPDNVRAKLMELELRYDMGEMTEEAYLAEEEILLDRLRMIRERQSAAAEE